MIRLDLRILFLASLVTYRLSFHVPHSQSISIDNDIVGEPDIECLDEEIRIWVKTRKVFGGRIYAKGKADVEECYKDDFSRERTKKPHFDLKFGVCGMRSLRSVDPRGMYYGITIVVSFHPLFITKVDQAFHVKCFFEEASRGLTAELGVSMIPTTELEARHGIPGCSYSIHRSSIEDLDEGKAAGPPIQFARVGDRVLHQWHCNDSQDSGFQSIFQRCLGSLSTILCPVDPILITGIRYSADLQRAYAESSVFKFADKPGVWFFCQIQMCMKKAGMCQGITVSSATSTPRAKVIVLRAPMSMLIDRSDVKIHENFGIMKTSVSQSFETEEDLKTSSVSPKKSSKVGKSDYNDYEDVTIPPNLTDLLANLPDDLSPETLQKMFRLVRAYTVKTGKNRKLGRRPPRAMRELRAGDLRSGNKIDQIQVDWTSGRRRDVDKPMISGQLLIFELDEEPPEVEGRTESGETGPSAHFAPLLLLGGLLAVAGGLGAVCAALFIAVLSMFIRLSRVDVRLCFFESFQSSHESAF
ncbi:unnamed protein product [Heligmosomoides polygyrus]|uniref:ZP domain-containing protein n=1 Tax=Heligmosomoides polygyrus TaxID=6339 RepID=A0A3P8AL71_HELPZ|nr:unnamed protein product [Heligmosomoides polygyrus]